VSDDIPEWERKLLANKPPKEHRDAVFNNVVSINGKNDIRAYSLKALVDELYEVANAPEGTRNHTLNNAALKLGTLVAAGGLTQLEVIQPLLDAAIGNGLPESEAVATTRSGYEFGLLNPREIPNSVDLLDAFIREYTDVTPTPSPITPEQGERALEGHTEPLKGIEPESDDEPALPYADLTWAANGEVRPPTLPSIGERNDGAHILYAGKINGIYGDPETAKTWFALHLAQQVLSAGGTVALIDIDHNGENDTVDRLRKLGVSNQLIGDAAHFRYYIPETPAELLATRDNIIEQHPTLCILDSIGELIPMLGLDSNSNDDISRGYRAMLTPLAQEHTAVLTIDHLAKAGKSDHGYAIGGIAKKRIINGAYYHAEALTIPAPGIVGKVRIMVTKDRPGGIREHAPQGSLGNFIIDSSASDGHINTLIANTIGSPLRPTNTMERISRLLAGTDGMHKTTINKQIAVKQATMDQAIIVLVQEGYVRTGQVAGKTIYYHERDYRQLDEELNSLNKAD
jgi:hypothetical protein